MNIEEFFDSPKYKWQRRIFYYPIGIVLLGLAYIIFAGAMDLMGYLFGFVIVLWVVTLPFKLLYKLIKMIRGR